MAGAGVSTRDTHAFLQLKGVTKGFAGVTALAAVDLEVFSGEVLALVGENGAGKSTMLRVLGGEHSPDSGTIQIQGRPARFASPRDAARAGIHVIHQEPELAPSLTVAENLFLGETARGRRHWVSWPRLHQEATDLLTRFGFERDLDSGTLLSELLPAQRQLVEIVRALKREPRLLALDEPTSSLTQDEVERLFKIVLALRSKGVGIIYVSHLIKEIFKLADRIAVLRDGALIAVKSTLDTSEDELVRLMVGRHVDKAFEGRVAPRDDQVLRVVGLSTSWLQDVSFHVRRGEVLGVAGLIGSGRTELGKALYGQVPRSAGQIFVDDRVVDPANPGQALDGGISYTPEDRRLEALMLPRNLRENVSLAALKLVRRVRFVRPKLERLLVQDLITRLRIKASSTEAEVSTLSGGNQQKVVLARSLSRRPKVLILDEPTRGIDVGSKAEIYRFVFELARSGVAIVYISSELPEVLAVSDRVMVLELGKVTGFVDAHEATEESVLRLAMQQQLTVSTK
jgi:ABC-type sugar transport system ATPase subunit